MARLVALSSAGALVFAGFGAPFLIPGALGLVAGIGIVVAGAVVLWIAESRTRNALNEDTPWNRLLKAEGENLVERDRGD